MNYRFARALKPPIPEHVGELGKTLDKLFDSFLQGVGRVQIELTNVSEY